MVEPNHCKFLTSAQISFRSSEGNILYADFSNGSSDFSLASKFRAHQNFLYAVYGCASQFITEMPHPPRTQTFNIFQFSWLQAGYKFSLLVLIIGRLRFDHIADLPASFIALELFSLKFSLR